MDPQCELTDGGLWIRWNNAWLFVRWPVNACLRVMSLGWVQIKPGSTVMTFLPVCLQEQTLYNWPVNHQSHRFSCFLARDHFESGIILILLQSIPQKQLVFSLCKELKPESNAPGCPGRLACGSNRDNTGRLTSDGAQNHHSNSSGTNGNVRCYPSCTPADCFSAEPNSTCNSSTSWY